MLSSLLFNKVGWFSLLQQFVEIIIVDGLVSFQEVQKSRQAGVDVFFPVLLMASSWNFRNSTFRLDGYLAECINRSVVRHSYSR